jgi:ribA/ribD-fused uncharacterized protein
MVAKTRLSTRKTPQTSSTSKAPPSVSNAGIIAQKTRQTETHIFFSAGPLSNWYKRRTYSGARALALTIDLLDENNIDHPLHSALSSRLLAAHTFNCGEQWMMAVKGWLFERDIKLSEEIITNEEFETILAQMLSRLVPSKDQPLRRELYLSTLCSVLRTPSPKAQKSFGRKSRNFDPAIWDAASIPVVVACSRARAEADHLLKQIYFQSGNRTFVEGSRKDIIWGVGIHWAHPSIQDPKNWRGTNRLGVCHGLARDALVDNIGHE